MTNPALGNNGYYIEVLNSSGDTIGIYSDGISLRYTNKLMKVGMMLWTVHDDHPVISQLTEDLYFRVFLQYTQQFSYGIRPSWEEDFIGVYRSKISSTSDNGTIYHVLQIPHANHILTRSIIGSPAGTDEESSWENEYIGEIIEDIIHLHVVDIAGINDRVRTVDNVPGSNMNLTTNLGTQIDYSCHWRPVLEVIQELCDLGDLDFAVEWENIGGVYLRFNLYDGNIGSDLSDDIIFDLGMANLGQASLTDSKLQEKTVGIVAGQGSEGDRTIEIRTGSNYSTTNSKEVFIDARDLDDDTLQDYGDAHLAYFESKEVIDAQLLQTFGYAYKRDYDFGDLISVRFLGTTQTKKISEISVAFSQDGPVEVLIGLEDE